jgi:hypothetical protein
MWPHQVKVVVQIAIGLVLAVEAAPLGCSSPPPQTVTTSALVPAASGTVDASRMKDGNTQVILRVAHLAPPGKITPGAATYVVWIRPPNGQTIAAGRILPDRDLQGQLQTVTPYDQFQLIVTPEANAMVSQPTHDPVITADVKPSR